MELDTKISKSESFVRDGKNTTPSCSCLRVFAFLLFLGVFSSFQGYGQCIGFVKSIAKPLLGDFVHDGNYNATILGEGESAELIKTFFEGHQYRLVVTGVKSLPDIHFVVMDMDQKILFDNAKFGYIQKWNFKMESTEKLIVKLQVLENDDPSKNTGGCVAILFGVKDE